MKRRLRKISLRKMPSQKASSKSAQSKRSLGRAARLAARKLKAHGSQNLNAQSKRPRTIKLDPTERPGKPLTGAVEGAGTKKPQSTPAHLLVVLAIVALGLIIAAKDVDLDNLGHLLSRLKLSYIAAAAGCFFLFMLAEAYAYKLLLRSSGYRVSIWRCYVYGLSDYFFSSISPGGSAGQFGQFYMMQRDGISGAACLSSLFSFNMLYHLVLCIFAFIAFISGATAQVAHNTATTLIIVYGIGAQVLFSLCIGALLFSTRLVPNIIRSLSRFARRSRFLSRFAPSKRKTDQFLEEYRSYGKRAKEQPLLLLRVSIILFAQMSALYAIPYFVAQAMGNEVGFLHMLAFQSVCVVATESIPLPGGAGASEIFFTSAYSTMMPGDQAFGLMLLTRTLSLYLGLIVGGLAVSLVPRTHLISTQAHHG